MSLISAPFYFLRHGETDWNKSHRSMGQTDIPLNTTGLAQAKEAALILRKSNIQSIASSPLSRALTTAEIIAETIRKPITIFDGLKECKWGTREGHIKGKYPWLEEWKKGAFIEGAETYAEFVQRVFSAFQKILKLPTPVLIVAHGGVYWAIQEVLSLQKEDIRNCIPIFHRPPEHPNHPWFVCSLGE